LEILTRARVKPEWPFFGRTLLL